MKGGESRPVISLGKALSSNRGVSCMGLGVASVDRHGDARLVRGSGIGTVSNRRHLPL